MNLEGTGMRLGFLGAREGQTQNNFLEASRDSTRPKNSILGDIWRQSEHLDGTGIRLTFLGGREGPPKMKVPKPLCFTVFELSTYHFAAEWRG